MYYRGIKILAVYSAAGRRDVQRVPFSPNGFYMEIATGVVVWYRLMFALLDPRLKIVWLPNELW